MADEEKDLSKQWSESPEGDRKAILGSIRAHVRQTTDRRAQYLKDHADNTDSVILEAFDARQSTAELALQILGA